MLGGLIYFVSHHFQLLKSGWKVVLEVFIASFGEHEEPTLKEKCYAVVKKIVESKFTVMPL